jgi:hypothetical protein
METSPDVCLASLPAPLALPGVMSRLVLAVIANHSSVRTGMHGWVVERADGFDRPGFADDIRGDFALANLGALRSAAVAPAQATC